jgi:probable rRNA maturation factor
MPDGDTRSRLCVTCTDERGCPIRGGALARWLERAAPARARGAVNVAVVSDRRMRALNRRFLGKDYATDVLSFPGADSHSATRRISRTHSGFLGDIVIARGVAAEQARAAGHSTSVEYRLLALHGLLHLIGYDHEGDNGQMARAEARLRSRAGLPETLIARAKRAVPRRKASSNGGARNERGGGAPRQ